MTSDTPRFWPLDESLFHEEVEPAQAIQAMIEQGYLHGTLTWITDWLGYRDPDRSVVVRYEDFVTSQRGTLTGLSQFLWGRTPSEDTLTKCLTNADGWIERENNSKTVKFPFGWTGEIGISRKYFSEENFRS